MNLVKEPKRLALVVIDTARQRFTRYVGNQPDRIIECAGMTERDVEHFRINPSDFIAIHCGPDAA
ncbi:hypothetical protein [Paraburkholderia tropica]|uniref:hypothetical protein n=1 Tax=Paraburkholderia tropica TaxID=92647 RepID=UPI002AB65CB3|nr:hypothetical protein [Paraburkholderia tropica]